MKRYMRLLPILALLTLVPLSVSAQSGDSGQVDVPRWGGQWAQADAPPPPSSPDAPRPDRRHLEQFRMLKLLELLDLEPDQEMEFLVSFRAMRAKQQALQEQRELYLTRLGEGLSGDSLGDAAIGDLVLKIMALKKEHFNVSEKFILEMDRLLTAEQVGKLVVFQERFELRLLEQMRGFRERGGMRGGGGRRHMQRDGE